MGEEEEERGNWEKFKRREMSRMQNSNLQNLIKTTDSFLLSMVYFKN